MKNSFRRVIYTARSAKLSLSHGAATWNFLYGFVEQGTNSSDPRIRDFFFRADLWIEIFEIFLAKAQSNKSKPMKQMLSTLMKVLIRNPTESVQHQLLNHVISSTTAIIYSHHDFPSVKPALQVLELFISKNIIRGSEIIAHLARQGSLKSPITLPDSANDEVDGQGFCSISHQLRVNIIENFLKDIITWVRYPDIAPTGGRLIATFYRSLQEDSTGEVTPHLRLKQPLWVKPVVDLLERDPLSIEILEHHILPGLLTLDNTFGQPFLDMTLLQDLHNGNVQNHSVVEIQLCLLALKLRAESNSRKSGMIQ